MKRAVKRRQKRKTRMKTANKRERPYWSAERRKWIMAGKMNARKRIGKTPAGASLPAVSLRHALDLQPSGRRLSIRGLLKVSKGIQWIPPLACVCYVMAPLPMRCTSVIQKYVGRCNSLPALFFIGLKLEIVPCASKSIGLVAEFQLAQLNGSQQLASLAVPVLLGRLRCML